METEPSKQLGKTGQSGWKAAPPPRFIDGQTDENDRLIVAIRRDMETKPAEVAAEAERKRVARLNSRPQFKKNEDAGQLPLPKRR